MKTTVIAAALVITASLAHADTKSEAVAVMLPLAGEAASASMFAVGFRENDATLGITSLVGLGVSPSLGHWYAGHYVTRGLVTRAAGFAFIGLMSLQDRPVTCAADGTCHQESPSPAIPLLGIAAIAIGTIDDLVTTPSAVRRRNAAYHLRVAPLAAKQTAGIALSGQF